MPLRYLDDPGLTLGMIRDLPSWQIPAGGCFDSLNFVYDVPGLARQRMGSTALVSGSQTAFNTSLGFVYSQDSTAIEELYGVNGKDGKGHLINKSTGASTQVGDFAGDFIGPGIVGRPVRHFGFVLFPMRDNGQTATTGNRNLVMAFAGCTTAATAFNSVNTSSITATNPLVTLSGADTTTNIKVGCFVGITDATHLYLGRVTAIVNSTTFNVWPPPTWTNAAIAANALHTSPYNGNLFSFALHLVGGSCAASFQNRLLYGNTIDIATTSGRAPAMDRRVYYSVLPTETIDLGGGQFESGATFLRASTWPVLNYFDVPGADPVVAMEPISGNQLLILTATHPVVLSGNLTTQLATTSPTITWDLSDINVNAGCLSDLSVQRTPKGVVWAGAGDIFAWNGREPVSLTAGTISTYWRGLVRGSSFAVHGSAYFRGQYLISGTSAGSTFAVMGDLTGQTPKWTRASGVGTDIFYGLARPTDPSQVFASRWWDQTGAAPSFTNGQTLRLESMLNPYTAGATTTDADGSSVPFSLTTRVITGDPETQKLWQRLTERYSSSMTAANVTVTAQSKIDAADIQAGSVRALGSLSSTATSTVTNATNANPIVVTTSAAHGLQDEDYVNIDAVLGNLNANGRCRIKLINSTSFSIIGGIGSGAYTSGGQVQKLTETDFLASPLNAGQGVSLTIASSGAVNNFEHHGVRVAMLERDQVMSS